MGADYVLWRRFGSAAEYDLWRSHFGEPLAASGAALSDVTSVPEPGTIVMLVVGGFSMATFTRRRKPVAHNCV